jgi:YegS C-terminal NAD kinase beta sandwich-like domain
VLRSSYHATGRDAALHRELRALSRCTTEPTRLKSSQDSPHRRMRQGLSFSWEGRFVAVAIGNGRQAGGGVPLCPDALLDDGLLDLMILQIRDVAAGNGAL